MRILITNDDGISAPGLAVLDKIAHDLAGPEGEVFTVAPAFEQSGVGHCISYTKPMSIAQFGPRRFAVDGSPADCVLAALYDVMQDTRPDLVLSGVNRGNNAGENTLYSGTIGATIEAALHGVKAIAMSQYYGPDNADLDEPFDAAAQHALPLIHKLLSADDWGQQDYMRFYNVNFPPKPASGVRGTRVSTQGFRRGGGFATEPHFSPSGRKFLWVKGGPQQEPTLPGTDVADNLAGYISVTPMLADLTDYAAVKAMDGLF
jgi:5'-nucleotidase